MVTVDEIVIVKAGVDAVDSTIAGDDFAMSLFADGEQLVIKGGYN